MLILLFTELSKEPRANRQIRHFAKTFDVTTVGYGALDVVGVTHIELPESVPQSVLVRRVFYVLQTVFFALRLYRLAYRSVDLHRWTRARLALGRWDIIIAHDINTVPLANRLRSRYGVIVDLHEYAPRQYEHSAEWVRRIAPYYEWICRREVARAQAVVTVSQGIVDEYSRRFAFTPVLVTNATPYAELSPGSVGSPIRLVHSGIAAPPRKLEIMVDAVHASTADVTLDLFLVPSDPAYLARLRESAGGDPRITFRDAVPYRDLVSTLNRFDIGVSIIAATTFNHEWSLPNKFFDYVQARLGIIVGPSPEMSRIVDEFGLGAIAERFDANSLIDLLATLNPDQVERWKKASDNAAGALSGERQMAVLDDLVTSLVGPAR